MTPRKPNARRRLKTADQFWSFVDRSGGPQACWPWLRGDDGQGYGQVYFEVEGKVESYRAHSVAFYLEHGWRPSRANGRELRHTCDNRPCCNPAHLLAGTHAENMRDMLARGRWRAGRADGRTWRSQAQAARRSKKHLSEEP